MTSRQFETDQIMDDPNPPQAATRRNVRRDKILLIDYSPDQCDLIQTLLHDWMPEVELLIASTAEAALRQLHLCLEAKMGLPRLILSDLYLPRVDNGLLLVEQLKRADSPYRLTPLTLLTHSDRAQDIQRVYDLGANSYIVKPVNYDQWRVYIEALRQYWWHTVTLPLV